MLLLLETPSVAGTHGSGLISLDNDDATAANLWRACRAVGLERRTSLVWNAVPWFVGTPTRGRPPTAADLRAGAGVLPAFLDLLVDLRVLVALGRCAQTAVAALDLASRGLVLLSAPHPSQRVYNRPGLDARGRVHAALATAAALSGGAAAR